MDVRWWADVGWTFSGGGFSHVFDKPSYQDSLPGGSTSIGSMRGVSDVGFQASAGTGALVYITLPPDGQSGLIYGSAPCSTGWYDIGGTSLCCPQWAGLVAIADQINGGGLGLINPALYKIGADPDAVRERLLRHAERRESHPRPGERGTRQLAVPPQWSVDGRRRARVAGRRVDVRHWA
ncbi:MAG TPA: hypothetical protein VFR11_16440 [Micromonosporaceae bacterium]|jgi:subtilase family serine protease|nr:hypothetical protein [Micromonosporaceae bacterium]